MAENNSTAVFTGRSGRGIYYEVHRVGNKAVADDHPKHKAVVLLHGGTGSIKSFDTSLLPGIADLGHTVIAIETRGHCRSAGCEGIADTEAYTLDVLCDDVVQVLDECQGQATQYKMKPLPDVYTFVGFSNGGVVAVAMGMKHRRLVSHIIAMGVHFNMDDPPAGGKSPFIAQKLAALSSADAQAADWEGFFGAEAYASHIRVSPDGQESAGGEPNWRSRVGRRLARLFLDFPAWVPADILRLCCGDGGIPVLFCVGDRDPIIRLPHVIGFIDRVRAEASEAHKPTFQKLQIAVVPGAGHACFRDRPALVLHMIREFLSTSSE